MRLWIAIAACALVSCEPARSKQPLSDPKTAKVDPRYVGVWSGKLDDGPVYLHVAAHADGQMDLVLVGDTGKRGSAVLHYQGHATIHKGATYLSLRAKRFPNPLHDDYVLEETWIFAKAELAKDGALTLAWMDDKPVSAAIAAGKLKGQKAEIDDTPEQILAFIDQSDPKVLWTKLATSFRKITPR